MFSTSKILVPVCAALIGVFTAAPASAEAYEGQIQVWFSPNGGVKQAVIDAARQA